MQDWGGAATGYEKVGESIAHGGQRILVVYIFRQEGLVVFRRPGQRQFGKQVAEVGIGFQAIGLGGFNQAEVSRTGTPTGSSS